MVSGEKFAQVLSCLVCSLGAGKLSTNQDLHRFSSSEKGQLTLDERECLLANDYPNKNCSPQNQAERILTLISQQFFENVTTDDQINRLGTVERSIRHLQTFMVKW